MNVQQIGAIAENATTDATTDVVAEVPSHSFGDVLKQVVVSANQDQIAAESAAENLAQGKTDAESVILSAVQADLSFNFLIGLRNKLVESYQDLSRMQF